MPAATNSADPPLRAVRSLNVFLSRLAEGAARLLHQIGLDESVDVAIENPIDVPDLLLRAVVFDELVGLQHVAANLAAEGDLFLRTADLLELRLLLLLLQVVQPRLQNLHGGIAVPVLRALVLA